MEYEGPGLGTDRLSESDDFFYGFSLHVQGNQERGDLGIGACAGKDFSHDGAGLFAAERLAMIRDSMENVGDHERYKVSIGSWSQRNVMRFVCPITTRSIKSRVCYPQLQAAHIPRNRINLLRKRGYKSALE